MKAKKIHSIRAPKSTMAISLLAFAALTSPLAMAADPGWYIGGNVGQSKAFIDDDQITRDFLGAGFVTTALKDDDSDIGFKLFGGYQFNEYFALEGGYVNMGKFGFDATTLPAGTLSSEIKLQGLNFDAVGVLPMTDKFSAFARVGMIYAEAKDTFSGTGAVTVLDRNPEKSQLNPKIGVGLEYDFTRSFGMRVEAERYRINDAISNKGDVDVASIGLVYRFGEHKKHVAIVAAAAQCPEAAPAQCPAVTPVAAPVLILVPVSKTEEYCSILDIQFEIDMNDIQREEKERLAVIGTFLKKYPDNNAVIEGHTDNVGSAKHNRELSLQRAISVVDYLVKNYNIDPARLQAIGYGEKYPVASNSTEEGKRENRRINAVIACATDVEGLKVAKARTTMALEMEFDTNQADVKPQYRAQLQNVAKYLNDNHSVSATIEGHAGNLQGTPEEIMAISQRRAQNVAEYLVTNFGVDRSQLSTEGFGKTRRFAYNTTQEGQQENRRVNIIFSYKK